ncbi:MAG: hypothetical protein ACK417_12220 [Bacteroidia bacterium]
MKTKAICFLLLVLFETSTAQAQNFKAHFSSAIPYARVKFQIELPLKSTGSYGISLNHFATNWEGFIVEPFARLYAEDYQNDKGYFSQVKLAYGILNTGKTSPNYQAGVKDPHEVFGIGIGYGRKFLIADYFTLDIVTGLRLLTNPGKLNKDYPQKPFGFLESERFLWRATHGNPIDLQIKLGFQL